jgi:hypothetical protein
MSFKWPATIITGQAVAVPIAPIVPIGQGAVTSWQLGRTWSNLVDLFMGIWGHLFGITRIRGFDDGIQTCLRWS